ncbi:MAG: DNA-binding response regulator [Caldilineae bacterium]|nr:MAG: DNA-binding response regulator [Caldilineae bacterium]
MRKLPIRLLIVDDHAVVRRGLKMVLSLRPEIDVIGDVGTGAEALEIVQAQEPDLVLLDMVLPDLLGPDLLPRLRALCPRCKVLALSGVQTASLVRQAVDAGVDGYVPKEVTPDELLRAIHQVMDGQTYLHPKITALLTRVTPLVDGVELPLVAPALTPREQEVLALMATTATNREIAERLHVSEETIRTHVKAILRKLNQSSRTQAVLVALKMGLLELE